MVRMHGFTLFELLACLALVATIAGGAALRLPDVLAAVRLGGAVQRLSAALRQARGHALERGGPVEVALDDTRQAWEVREVSATTLAREALPPGVTFASLPASRRVRFTALGTTDNATITLGAGAAVRRIVVIQRGRVRVQ
jgi:prepilin-type N-terminal cleavage/methylation domain-containing protein